MRFESTRIAGSIQNSEMIACLDVDYRGEVAVAAAVCGADWSSSEATLELVELVTPVAPYEPGLFFKRELPCLLKVIAQLPEPPEIAIVDSFVWLGDESKPGLGAHLFRALAGQVAVVGVAKTLFNGALPMVEILRGESLRPLFVSAAGLDLDAAAAAVRAMAGPFRIPTLIKRADQLCRHHQP